MTWKKNNNWRVDRKAAQEKQTTVGLTPKYTDPSSSTKQESKGSNNPSKMKVESSFFLPQLLAARWVYAHILAIHHYEPIEYVMDQILVGMRAAEIVLSSIPPTQLNLGVSIAFSFAKFYPTRRNNRWPLFGQFIDNDLEKEKVLETVILCTG